MPRTPIELVDHIDHLSILDENGNLDAELEPDIPEELLLRLYATMLLGRRFDERMLSLQRQGRVGTFAPIKGHEAAQLGAVAHLRDSDWLVPSFRETVAEIWRGRRLEDILLYFGGVNDGGRIEAERNDLPIAVPVGSQLLHAVGLAWAMKYRRKDEVAMTFFGDGATSEGDFHEGLNLAGVFDAPVVFICQNNQWAISIPRSRQTRSQTLAQKALAYGLPGIQVDGNDILAVHAATAEAVARARAGGGATLIECVTYRVIMHTTADDPRRYRTDAEVEEWVRRDPLIRFQNYLVAKNVISSDRVASLETEVKSKIQTAVEAAEARFKTDADPLEMFDHAYARMPAHLVEQRAALAAELSAREKEVDHG